MRACMCVRVFMCVRLKKCKRFSIIIWNNKITLWCTWFVEWEDENWYDFGKAAIERKGGIDLTKIYIYISQWVLYITRTSSSYWKITVLLCLCEIHASIVRERVRALMSGRACACSYVRVCRMMTGITSNKVFFKNSKPHWLLNTDHYDCKLPSSL